MGKVQKYDIIIVGAGGAGLSLASAIAQTKGLSNKSVLLLDKTIKEGNDRTWCFWENGRGAYDADFYRKARAQVDEATNIDFRIGEVISIDENQGVVNCIDQKYVGEFIFSSKLSSDISFADHLYTDQHFGGWFVEFEEKVFDSEAATFMDFRIDQNNEHRFCYVLPLSDRKALVEVAIFSNSHLTNDGYDEIIEDYIKEYVSKSQYLILEKEYGIIPMTNYPFWNHNKGKLFHIGTAGGAVKPSSGFAFKRIQQHTKLIIDCLLTNQALSNSYKIFRGRHLWYDSIMLHVLEEQKIPGEKVFSDLFEKTEVNIILRFLDGATSLSDDLQIIKAPAKWPFIKGMSKVVSPFK